MKVGTGVELQKDANGKITHVTIDLRMHLEAIPHLKEAGFLPRAKADLEKDFDNGLTVDEAFDGVSKKIEEHFAKRQKNKTD